MADKTTPSPECSKRETAISTLQLSRLILFCSNRRCENRVIDVLVTHSMFPAKRGYDRQILKLSIINLAIMIDIVAFNRS